MYPEKKSTSEIVIFFRDNDQRELHPALTKVTHFLSELIFLIYLKMFNVTDVVSCSFTFYVMTRA